MSSSSIPAGKIYCHPPGKGQPPERVAEYRRAFSRLHAAQLDPDIFQALVGAFKRRRRTQIQGPGHPSVASAAQNIAELQAEIATLGARRQNRRAGAPRGAPLLRRYERVTFEKNLVAVPDVAPGSSGDVPDEPEARLAVLGPEYTHTSKSAESTARAHAVDILENRGTSPRRYRNMLVFLAADRDRLSHLEQSVRRYLAWKSIEEESTVLKDYRDVAQVLAEAGVISPDLAERFKSMISSCHRLVHLYWQVDDELVRDYLENSLGDFSELAQAFARLVKTAD